MEPEKKKMLEIHIDKNGNLYIYSLVKTKEFCVNILADAMKVVAMQENTVLKITNENFGRTLKTFLARKK